MTVPYAFASATTSIPLSELDANFNTPITLGNTAIQLGNTVTTLNNMTLANATVSSGNVTVTSASLGGNLTFTGTGNRITGDFSNSTIASRVILQTSTTNGQTRFTAIPNGTSTTGIIEAFNSSDITNASLFSLTSISTEARLAAGIAGTGTYQPMTFYTNGSEAMRIATSGNVGIGTGAPLTALNVNGAGGELIRISVTPDAGVIQEPALGFATGVLNTHPAAKISALEFDASDSRASLLFYTRGSNSDIAPTLRMTIGSDGLVELASASGLSIGRTAVTSPAATDGNVFSGTYTPTLTNSTNVAASTPVECFYTRVGNVVTVAGQVSIDVTTTLTDSVLLMTLPVASTFTAARNCGGTGASSTAGTYGTETIAISANVANGAAEFRLRPISVANLDYRFSFSYRVL